MRLIDAEPIEKYIENGLNEKDPAKRFGHDAIEIMTEIHYAPTIAPPPNDPLTNDPLTLEQLREMDGEPVRFPCKVGDLLYEIDMPEYGVITCKVLYISFYNGHAGHVPGNPIISAISVGVEVINGHGKGSSYAFETEDFGRLVFLSHEEAEEALEKSEGGAYRRRPERDVSKLDTSQGEEGQHGA